MKKAILLLCVISLSLTNLIGQNYYMTAPQGYGASATGGGSTSPITVTTYGALKTALTSSTNPAVILVSGTIDFTNSGMMQVVVKNKTLIGLPGATFVNTNQTTSGILYLKNGSTNVIIRNLLFIGPSARDNNGNDNMTSECTNLWVDHCEFQDGEDGNFDNKGNADNVTVSWCKFTYLKAPRPAGPNGTTSDHRFTNLVGSGPSDYPVDGHYSITWQNCYWAAGCKERMPRARNAELHILNCYYNTFSIGTKALGIGGGDKNSTAYVENSDFASIATVYQSYDGTDGGKESLTFTGCINGVANVTANGVVSQPTYSYSVLPVADVATFIPNATCGAGATLQVTSGGVISSCGGVAGILSSKAAVSSSVIYPNPVSESFRIQAKEDIKSLSILSIVGEELYTTGGLRSGVDAEIAVENLNEGIYLVKIEYTSGKMEMTRFVKSK